MRTDFLLDGLLEQYAFLVADQVIHVADAANQAALIRLINRLGPSSLVSDVDEAANESLPPIGPTPEQPFSHAPTRQLKEQYQAVLNTQSSQERIQRNNEPIYRLMALNQRLIESLQANIRQLQELLIRSKDTRAGSSENSITRHFQALIEWQEAYLIQLEINNRWHHERLAL